MTEAVTHDQWSHKGWSISFDMPPIPYRGADWTATSPDYDCDCDQDGFFKCSGEIVHAATYEDLLAEIEDCIAAQGGEARKSPPSQGCTVPPAGWYCTRTPGHDGPCAAYPHQGGEA